MNKAIRKTAQTLILSLTLLLGMQAQASGEGRNGPDVHGVSIPMKLDHLITQSQLNLAVKKCLSTYNSFLLSQMLRQRVDSQSLTEGNGSFDNYFMHEYFLFNLVSEGKTLNIHQRITYILSPNTTTPPNVSVRIVFRKAEAQYNELAKETFNVSEEIFKSFGNLIERTRLDGDNGLTGGFLVLPTSRKDIVRDQFGTPLNEETYVTSYEVRSTPIKNGDFTTKLSGYAEEVAQCIQNQL